MQARVSAGILVPRQLYVVQDGGAYYIVQAQSASTFEVVGRGAESPTAAIVSAIHAGLGADVFLSPELVWLAMAPVALTDAATIALDLSTGINFTVTISGNRTLGNPTNGKPGQQGTITMSRSALQTLSFASNWRLFGNADLPTDSGKGFKVIYDVITTSLVHGHITPEL